MAFDQDETAFRVHAHSFSIVAVVAGMVVAIIIFAVLLFVFYDGRNDFDPPPNSLPSASASPQARWSRIEVDARNYVGGTVFPAHGYAIPRFRRSSHLGCCLRMVWYRPHVGVLDLLRRFPVVSTPSTRSLAASDR